MSLGTSFSKQGDEAHTLRPKHGYWYGPGIVLASESHGDPRGAPVFRADRDEINTRPQRQIAAPTQPRARQGITHQPAKKHPKMYSDFLGVIFYKGKKGTVYFAGLLGGF